MAEKHALDIKKEGREDGAAHEKDVVPVPDIEVDAKEAEAHPYREWSEEALYEKAEAVGIEGYADMDKEDLITALHEH